MEHQSDSTLTHRFLELGGTFTYQLDFENMTQTNVCHKSRKSRTIRRTVLDESLRAAEVAQKAKSTQTQKPKVQSTGAEKRAAASSSESSSPTKKVKTASAAAAADSFDLKDGQEMQVPGRDYKVKNVGGVYSCTCPAWRYQSKKIDVRTCKHIQELRGANAEQVRMQENNTWLTTASSKTNSPKKSTNKATNTTSTNNKSQNGGVLFDAHHLTLAHKWDPSKNKNAANYLLSEKLDGMRALWNGVELVSRAGNTIDAPDFFLAGFPANMALDGELFMGRGQFQETISITRRKNGGEHWRQIKYVVFDAPTALGGFEERLRQAKNIVDPLAFAEILPHTPCQNENHLNQELERIEKLGGEGLMMREKGSGYQKGRSQKLLKVKTFVDDEGLVYGHQPGTGKHTGRMGALLCRLRNGTEFKVGTGFSDQDRENPPSIGSIVTVKYFELTKAGVPRFPTFQRIRLDVNASEFQV
uniref:SWIM-type domain-containing protein n=1 Tax=Entomoneis paludosa TaxID=265537 RepID=A0A7S3DM84_9STRA|mmetsp:Transcript_20384/g.42809  ORF Transcript_20384/g.42809 Transcript_20384/m.42809 type:complete len:472 (+) Transcript_20384:1-1416(+)